MSTGAILTLLIGSALALVLNWSALRNHALDRDQLLKMALIWAAAIAGLTLIISQVKV